jgi:hypothetical protein
MLPFIILLGFLGACVAQDQCEQLGPSVQYLPLSVVQIPTSMHIHQSAGVCYVIDAQNDVRAWIFATAESKRSYAGITTGQIMEGDEPEIKSIRFEWPTTLPSPVSFNTEIGSTLLYLNHGWWGLEQANTTYTCNESGTIVASADNYNTTATSSLLTLKLDMDCLTNYKTYFLDFFMFWYAGAAK